MRVGTILSSIGFGAAAMMTLVAVAAKDEGFLFLAGLGLVTFFLGFGFILNGVFLTAPRSGRLSQMPEQPEAIGGQTDHLRLNEPPSTFSSVTEHTTHHLYEKQPIKRD